MLDRAINSRTFQENLLPHSLVPLTSCPQTQVSLPVSKKPRWAVSGITVKTAVLSFWMHFIGPDFLEVLVQD